MGAGPRRVTERGARGSYTSDIAFRQAILLALRESPGGRLTGSSIQVRIEGAIEQLRGGGHITAKRARGGEFGNLRLTKQGRIIAGIIATTFWRHIAVDGDDGPRGPGRRKKTAHGDGLKLPEGGYGDVR